MRGQVSSIVHFVDAHLGVDSLIAGRVVFFYAHVASFVLLWLWRCHWIPLVEDTRSPFQIGCKPTLAASVSEHGWDTFVICCRQRHAFEKKNTDSLTPSVFVDEV